MTNQLEQKALRYRELENLISDPDIMKDMKRYRALTQEHASLTELMNTYNQYKELKTQLENTKTLIDEESDPEMREMAKEELKELEPAIEEKEAGLKLLLIPKDPMDSKNIIMEIRAGTGGDEAALFAADLFRMYSRYSEEQGWKTELIDVNENDLGGYKEIVYSISGKEVYGKMRYESGVHRVQRVPATESGGRIHTSAASVAVLPEVEDVDIEITETDLRIDTYRAQGAGGQHVNKTESAIRITHIPTGVVVTCQDEKSQHKNKARAMKVLRARLYEAEEEKKRSERAENRKNQVGSGDRSERIRTYNYPQNRITDHRINLTLYKLDAIIAGAMTDLIEPLQVTAREALMQSRGL